MTKKIHLGPDFKGDVTTYFSVSDGAGAQDN
jgi:hypothetical protein